MPEPFSSVECDTIKRLQEEILAFEARQNSLLEKNHEIASLLGKVSHDWAYCVQQFMFAQETIKREIKRWERTGTGVYETENRRAIEELKAALHCMEEAVCSR